METDTTQQNESTELVNILSAFKVKLDAANAQILQLGLLVEFLYKQIEEKDLGLDLESYPEWAQNRFKEIQELAESSETKQMQEEMKTEMEEIAKNIKL